MKKIIVAVTVLILMLFALFLLVLFGISGSGSQEETGSSGLGRGSGQALVEVALKEDGTVGGKKYWDFSYPGITYVDGSSTPWCGAFVNWCAEQIGVYPDIIPHTGLCTAGEAWFREKGLWQDNTYIPQPGDLVYFDFDGDQVTEHVGIVQFDQGTSIVTIEGNTDGTGITTGDTVAQKVRNKSVVLGYGTPAYPALSPDLEGDTVEAQVYNYFRALGYSKAASCGILGNLRAESGVNPGSIQANGAGPAAGICQWENYNTRSGRWLRLYERANGEGKDWTDLKVQLDFLVWELEGGDATTKYLMDRNYGGLETFKGMTNVRMATEAFEKCFERAGIPHMEKRIQYAYEYMEMFAGL